MKGYSQSDTSPHPLILISRAKNENVALGKRSNPASSKGGVSLNPHPQSAVRSIPMESEGSPNPENLAGSHAKSHSDVNCLDCWGVSPCAAMGIDTFLCASNPNASFPLNGTKLTPRAAPSAKSEQKGPVPCQTFLYFL